MYVSDKHTCTRLTISHTHQPLMEIADLATSQEEADTRLLLHCKHADEVFEKLIITSPDTDVAIIALGVIHKFKSTLGLSTGSSTNKRIIDLSAIYSHFGDLFCKALPYLHAVTGCDSTSAFFRKGKKKACKVVRNCEDNLAVFSTPTPKPSKELVSATEKLVSLLYTNNNKTLTVNDARYQLFKNGNSEQMLPPNDDCLLQHTRSASYKIWHSTIWHLCLEAKPDIPSPQSNGWHMTNGVLEITWNDKPVIPAQILKTVQCKCGKSGCRGRCSCKIANLPCCDLCSCIDSECCNRAGEDEEDDEDEN